MSYTATLAEVLKICSTYIVIQIIPINESFCGEDVTYCTTELSSQGYVDEINQTIHNITDLKNNTLYEITVEALRRNSIVHQTTINQSTLQPESKCACTMYPMCDICT